MKMQLIILCLIFFHCISLSQKQDSTFDSVEDHELRFIVANYDSSWFYRLDTQNLILHLIKTVGRAKNERWVEQLPLVLRQLDGNKKYRIRLSHQAMTDLKSINIKWADYSPNKSHVAVGQESPFSAPISIARVFHTASRTVSAIFEAGTDGSIEDMSWSNDSRYLCFLEQEEHFSKNPLDLISFIGGHPVPLVTFRLQILDVYLNKMKDIFICSNIRYGEGAFFTQ